MVLIQRLDLLNGVQQPLLQTELSALQGGEDWWFLVLQSQFGCCGRNWQQPGPVNSSRLNKPPCVHTVDIWPIVSSQVTSTSCLILRSPWVLLIKSLTYLIRSQPRFIISVSTLGLTFICWFPKRWDKGKGKRMGTYLAVLKWLLFSQCPGRPCGINQILLFMRSWNARLSLSGRGMSSHCMVFISLITLIVLILCW